MSGHPYDNNMYFRYEYDKLTQKIILTISYSISKLSKIEKRFWCFLSVISEYDIFDLNILALSSVVLLIRNYVLASS